MRTDVIQFDGDLKREVWTFDLETSHKIELRLMYYSFGTRLSTRHKKWIDQNHWDRLMQRDNTMTTPPYSSEVVAKAKQYFIEQIKIAEVTT
jgi:hypothetical protein